MIRVFIWANPRSFLNDFSAASSVLDNGLKVHGLDRLFVVDASVFPAVTSGNAHAPTVMVAHKGAAAILASVR